MTDLKSFFQEHARLSRRALAEFLDLKRSEVDDLAEDLDLGERLTLEEAQELMLALDEENEGEDDDSTEEEE